MKRFALALLLLALGLLAWTLIGSLGPDHADREIGRPDADRGEPTLATRARLGRVEADRTQKPGPTAGEPVSDGVDRKQYVIHVRGPGGVLAGAEVRVLRGDATEVLPLTDEAGQTAAILPPLDGAELAVCKHGFRVESWPLYQLDQWVAAGTVHLVLKPQRGVPIRGRVIDGRTKAPIEGARGTVNDWGRNPVPIGPTDADGWFTHPGVMDDHRARVTVSAQGYATTEIVVHADSGRLRPEVPIVEMEPGGCLTGCVMKPDGDPIAGAAVRVTTIGWLSRSDETPPIGDENRADLIRRYQYDDEILRGDEVSITVQSSSDGTFVAEGLRFGDSYKASASAPGFAASAETAPIQLEATNPAPAITLRLRAAGRIRLHLAGAGDAAIEGRPRVRLFRGGRPIKSATGNAAGPYAFDDLAPGRYHVWAQVVGFLPTLDEVVLAEGQSQTVDLRLSGGAEIEGIVLDDRDRPVPGIKVQAASAADNPNPKRTWLHQERKATSGADGRFRIAGLSPTDSVLIASGYVEGRGWLATQEALRVSPPVRDFRVIVKPMGTVKMRLMQPDGAPFSGELWTLTFFGSGGGGGSREITDGHHEEGMLEEGEHHLIIAPSGYAWFHRTVTIKDGCMVDWGEILLGPGVTLPGRIIDKDGHPVKGATIICQLWEHRATQTDADGHFALDRFPRERLEFRIEADGFINAQRTIDTGEPGLRIVLQRPATVDGRLVSERGALPRETWIELRPKTAKLIKERGLGPDGTMQEWSYWEGTEELYVDEQGRLRGELAPGAYDAYWYPEEGDDIFLGQFTFAEGENRGVRIVIPAK